MHLRCCCRSIEEKERERLRKQQQEPKSSDNQFDDPEARKMSKKAEDTKAWQNLQKQLEIDFDPESKSQEELQDFFRLSKEGKNAVDHMNEQVFEYLYGRLKDRQIRFYAFLNKEFNIMNYKSARGSMHCFDSTDRPVAQVNQCLKRRNRPDGEVYRQFHPARTDPRRGHRGGLGSAATWPPAPL
jgi:hypothetical protein